MHETELEGIKGDILIVDDDAPSLQTLSSILLEQGYGVRRARDAQTAWMIINNSPPDLILLDVRMPKMNGFEFCQKLKANKGISDIPVLFLSALDETEDKIRAFKVGGVDYITKPFQVEEVLARVQTHLDLYRLRYQLEKQNVNLGHAIKEQKRTQSELERSYGELERRVKARTAKLKDANVELKSEIAERQRAEDALKESEYNLKAEVEERKLREKELKQNETLIQYQLDKIKELNERIENENIYLRQTIELKYKHEEIVGRSKGIKHVLSQVEKVAAQNTCVLITGETGTGKELVAQAIHNLSPRKDRLLIKVNCSALPASLIESEMFGREKGAYTGALTRQIGRFEAAHKSTIFLDEIGDLPPDIQVKLLRVLQEGKFERLGSTKTIEADVRIITATNKNLFEAVRKGTFRNDLYYRLHVFPIVVPPLRERRDDIPLLTWSFVREFEEAMGKKIESISKHAMQLLQAYPWPGNIRELKNVVERAAILCDGHDLQIERIESESFPVADATLEEVTRKHIVKTLESARWRVGGKNGAAEILGLKRTTLLTKMNKMNIKRPTSRDENGFRIT